MSHYSEWHQVTGIIGTVLYINCYFLVQVGWIKAPSYRYCLLNITAASMVGISLLYEFNLASALIQISWILISIIGITKMAFIKPRATRKRHRRRRSYRGYYSYQTRVM